MCQDNGSIVPKKVTVANQKTFLKSIMLSLQVLVVLKLLFVSVSEAAVVFENPPKEGATVTVPEDKAENATLYNLKATDPVGSTPVFTIGTSQCESTPALSSLPSFTINSLDQLVVPKGGLDAEKCTQFKLTFHVTASNSASSGPLTINVTDVNEHPPSFSKLSYLGEVWKNDEQGQSVNRADLISAYDTDISNLPVTLSISGAQTTFAMHANGSVYVKNPSSLAPLASPTVLTIQASDGAKMSSATLSIKVHDDPCTSTPCINGGTCTSTRGNYKCSCLSGYTGSNCENVNYCSINPCQNGTCTNYPSGYTCTCSTRGCYTDVNCSVPCPTTPYHSTSTTTGTPLPPFPGTSPPPFPGTSPPPFPDSSTTTPYQNDSTSTSTIPPPMPCTRKWPFWIIDPVVCVFIIIGFIIWQCLDEQGKRYFMIIAPIVFVLMIVGITTGICFG